MPRQSRGPYLAIEDRGKSRKWYVIRDGSKKIRTGCAAGGDREDQRAPAELRLAEYIASKHQVSGERRSHKVGIADILLHYFRHGSSAATTKFCIARLDEFFQDKTVSEIKGEVCRAYLASRKTMGAKPSTARRELGVLSAAVAFYHKEYGLVPLPEVTLPPEGIARDVWMTRSQFAAMLWAAWRRPESKHLARYMLIAVYTGTRPAAIMKLRWLPSPVAGHIDIGKGVLYRRGSGERETKKRRPPSRLHVRLLAHMRRWRDGDMAQGISHVIHFRGKPVASIKRSWAISRQAAGLGGEFVPYCLKHTAATWVMQRGVDKWEAAGYLGISAEILESVYAHHHPDFQKNAAEVGTTMGQKRVPKR